jgi:hypothetical protein
MVVNIVDVGWATIKSGCLPITDYRQPYARVDFIPQSGSLNLASKSVVELSTAQVVVCFSIFCGEWFI